MKALIYIRASKRERMANKQCLAIQKEEITNFCRIHKISIKSYFEEISQGDNFNRNKWKELVEYLESNKGEIDFVLFTAWDRLSTNPENAISEIEKLIRYYNTVPNSTELFLDLSTQESIGMITFQIMYLPSFY